MRSPLDAKQRAGQIRKILLDYQNPVTHSQSLEILSKISGFRDWNTYCAYLKGEPELLPIPEGWVISGDSQPLYEVGIAPEIKVKGSNAAVIRSKSGKRDPGGGFVTLMQSVDALEYVGRRVQLEATLRSIDCTGAVTIWMRVDGDDTNNTLAFDNLENSQANGPLRQTTDWEHKVIVLDVPEMAESINFGFYLRGSGAGYAADFKLETVSEEVELTNKNNEYRLKKPTNLNFAENSKNASER